MINFVKKIFYILGETKKKFVFLSLVFLFIALLDFLGIGLFIPLVSILTAPEKISDGVLYGFFQNHFNLNPNSFGLMLVVVIFFVFLARNIIFILSNRYIFKYSFSQVSYLRKKLLSSYMDLPYEWHINKNSSRVVQNIVTETIQFCNIVMVPFLRLFGNIIILFFLFLLILRENVLFTLLLMLTIFLVFFIFHKFSQKTTPRLGKIISKSNEMIIKNIQQGLGSVKEAKITGKQDFFVKNMERLSVDYAESSTKQRTINISPVSIIEFSVVAYILAWIGAYTYLGKDLELLLPLLTVVALTGLRILPFMGMVMQTINNFHNADYFVNKLYQDLKYLEEVGRDVVRGEVKDFKKIEIKSLFFGYGGGDVLRDINISFKNKQVIGITGKTGSGKTTLINILLGLLENERGQFFVDNKEISNKSLRYLMAYIPQDIFLLDDSIRNNIAFGIEESKINEKKVIESLKSAQVYDLIESLPDGLDTIVGENGVRLSGGQRQRLGIARALYYDRKIFVFDEATSSLDYKTEKKVQEAISSLKDKKTVIMIAHRLKTLKDCDMIHVIEDGNIVKSGKHASIMKHLAN